MLFYILGAVTGALLIVGVIRTCQVEWGNRNYYDGGLGYYLAAFATATIGGVVLLALCATVPFQTTQTSESTYPLKALNNNSQTSGHAYFLGGGYVNEERVLNYIASAQGAFYVRSAPADHSKVYEGSEQPKVTVREHEGRNKWLVPWAFKATTKYEFHIPSESILSDYTLDNS